MAEKHECPHQSQHLVDEGGETLWYDCGYGGWLCDRCKEDRADRRAKWVASELHDLWEAVLTTWPPLNKEADHA